MAAKRPTAAQRRRAAAIRTESLAANWPPSTKAEIVELDRIVKEMDDPTRYVIASAFLPRFALYYDAESDCYTHNRPEDATAFKNAAVARAALKALLERRPKRKDDSLQILKARKTKHGLRMIDKPVTLLDRLRGNRKSRIQNRKS